MAGKALRTLQEMLALLIPGACWSACAQRCKLEILLHDPSCANRTLNT